MSVDNHSLCFGPVPSRRLGQSLGINNIPYKTCTYSCVYCQVGPTPKKQTRRETFYDPGRLVLEVEEKVQSAGEHGEKIDYLSFVPDGEPTLDRNLGDEIVTLRSLGKRIAVITNASLVWREDVREGLLKADWVSLKIDSQDRDTWRRINRPHYTLGFEEILNGILEFSKTFKGILATETMLVRGLNDTPEEIDRIARFVSRVNPAKSYVSVPIRPPAEKGVQSPSPETLAMSYSIFREHLLDPEYLVGHEANSFGFTGRAVDDLLSITAVHPMRENAVREFLSKAKAGWEVVETLIREGKLIETTYRDSKFYVRAFKR
jgi:wyosine [tRNA(Phe)-imidazoG37] synthetase (radical SAM superfamily)